MGTINCNKMNRLTIKNPKIRLLSIVAMLFLSNLICYSQSDCDETDLQAKIEKVDVSCNSGNDGEIRIEASGGSEPYEFSMDVLNTYSSSHIFTNLTAGSYQVYVRDANNCGETYDIEIIEPTYTELDIGPDIEIFSGMKVTFDAGENYEEYLWSNGETTRKATFFWEVKEKTSVSIYLEAYNAKGCLITSKPVSITVNPRIEESDAEIEDSPND
jgi:hypothetical protein